MTTNLLSSKLSSLLWTNQTVITEHRWWRYVLFCTFAAAAAAPPLISPASVWSQAYTHPQPGITETEGEGGGKRDEEETREDERRKMEEKGKEIFTWRGREESFN